MKFICRLMLTMLICIDLAESYDFSRTLTLKRNKTKKVGRGRFVKAIKKLTRIDPIPEIPEISTIAPKQAIGELNEDSFSFDICEASNLCLNNATCISHLNEYYCDCPSTHYGKTCEFKADKTNCVENLCMNNATCYSTKESRVVPNLALKEGAGKNVTMLINYDCWCRYGFHGAFCEFAETSRHCMEDRCNHHGIVQPVTSNANSTDCQCHCEEFYSGDECELISPCRDLECVNGGHCVLHNETGTASCHCPQTVEYVSNITIHGEQCENITIPDDVDACIPCSGNFDSYARCLLEINGEVITRDDIAKWMGPYCLKNDEECLEGSKQFDCMHGGTCSVGIGTIPFSEDNALYDKLFLVPKCACPDNYTGDFCFEPKENPCEKLAISNGVARCENGTCVHNAADDSTTCICHEGFRGARCEKRDPCVPNPCGDALCVEFPLSDTFSATDLKHTCICKTSQGVDETTHTCRNEAYKVCQHDDNTPKCENGGHCYPCALDPPHLSALALCDEADGRRGFRCVCPPGFHPPLCRENATICDSHHCQNGGTCETIPENPLDYKCICPRGFTSTFCHIYLGVCIEKGDEICGKNGKCVPDDHYKRTFRCDCTADYEGLNCDHIIAQKSIIATAQDHFAVTYPFIVCVLSAFMLCVVGIYRKRTSKVENPKG